MIFVDNAGVDFVLGVLPMVRELAKLKSKVILSANSAPALNDITYPEVKECIKRAAIFCPILDEGLKCGLITVIENGQKGPCLDLRTLNKGRGVF